MTLPLLLQQANQSKVNALTGNVEHRNPNGSVDFETHRKTPAVRAFKSLFNELNDLGMGHLISGVTQAGFNQLSHFGHLWRDQFGGQTFGEAFKSAKETGDFSTVAGMLRSAEAGKRQPSGFSSFFSKFAPIGLLGAGAALTGGFGLSSLLNKGLSGVTGLASATGSAGNLLPVANTVSGSTIGKLSGQGLMGTLGGIKSAGAGLGTAVLPSSNIFSKLSNLSKISNLRQNSDETVIQPRFSMGATLNHPSVRGNFTDRGNLAVRRFSLKDNLPRFSNLQRILA